MLYNSSSATFHPFECSNFHGCHNRSADVNFQELFRPEKRRTCIIQTPNPSRRITFDYCTISSDQFICKMSCSCAIVSVRFIGNKWTMPRNDGGFVCRWIYYTVRCSGIAVFKRFGWTAGLWCKCPLTGALYCSSISAKLTCIKWIIDRVRGYT